MSQFAMVDLVSSNIKRAGHSNSDKVLRIEFMSGTIGDYYPVSKEEYNEFLHSESKGKHFVNKIKNQKLYIPVDKDDERNGIPSTVLVKNPTEKSLVIDENKGRIEQTSSRINQHFFEVRNALREKQNLT